MELNAKQTRAFIETQMDCGNNVLVMGAPGIGKSDLVRQIAADRGINLIDLRLSTIDAVDLRGLPAIENGKAVFYPMGELPDEAKHGKEGILFLDELPQALMTVQNASFSLTLDKRIGEYHLPQGWKIVAAGNRVKDKSGANRLNAALANRFTHCMMGVSVDDWSQWALTKGNIPAELVAFIRFRPELLHSFDVDSTVNATPRTWAMVANLMRHGMSPDMELPLLAGTVGESAAVEFLAFLRVWRNLPNPDAVLMNPDSAEIPRDGATLYALCGALARKVTVRTIGNFLTYANRLPAEYRVLMAKDATRRDPSLTKTPEMVTFLALNSEVYL